AQDAQFGADGFAGGRLGESAGVGGVEEAVGEGELAVADRAGAAVEFGESQKQVAAGEAAVVNVVMNT
ncbi:hypothetical protein, partial [Embleya sp. NPDC059259]|uniref:hypothetical protein n=1 Tax=unclassified Embleya TaxID=2699296 RepID=UPI0036C22ED9